MKGIELPINALIIIVLAVIILIAIIALFYTGSIGPRVMLTAKAVLDNACLKMRGYNCDADTMSIAISDFDADNDGKVGDIGTWAWGDSCNPSRAADGDNLAALCACYYQVSSEQECKKLCQC